MFLIDVLHAPFGCSVWPVFWTRALNWPHGGEINIFEAANNRTFNQMSLHADSGCSQASDATQLGKTVDTDCSASTNSSSIGCGVQETKESSFGTGFHNAGGGVFAAQLEESGVS